MNPELNQKKKMSDWEAKEFFIRKIMEQAKNEGILLTETEKQVLNLRFGDPNSLADPGLKERIKKEIKMTDFFRKISWLIKGKYEDDLNKNSAARDTYRQAFKALKLNDRYLYLVVDKAIGRDINKVGLFLGSYPTARGFKLKIFFLGIFFIFGLGIFFKNGKISVQQIKENKDYVFPMILLGITIVMTVLGYMRFKKDDYFANKNK